MRDERSNSSAVERHGRMRSRGTLQTTGVPEAPINRHTIRSLANPFGKFVKETASFRKGNKFFLTVSLALSFIVFCARSARDVPRLRQRAFRCELGCVVLFFWVITPVLLGDVEQMAILLHVRQKQTYPNADGASNIYPACESTLRGFMNQPVMGGTFPF